MSISIALCCVIGFQGGTAAIVPDPNRYQLKAEHSVPVPIAGFLSHPGLFTNISKPLTIRFNWSRPLIQLLRYASVGFEKMRLDRISPQGKVIASYDLTGYQITRFRIGDGIGPDESPVVTFSGPSVSATPKNTAPQPTDQKKFAYRRMRLTQKIGNESSEVDWGFISLRDLKIEGSLGHYVLKSQGAQYAGKAIPNPAPKSLQLRIDLKCSGEPDLSLMIFTGQPTIKRIQGTAQQFSLSAPMALMTGGNFP